MGRVDSDSESRPQDRANVAQFYAATAPVPVWNAAASQVAVEQGRSMSENARALALVNMAISDAQASVFETKYHYRFWRPETAIRAGDADGNLTHSWRSRFHAVRTHTVLPELCIGARQLECRGS